MAKRNKADDAAAVAAFIASQGTTKIAEGVSAEEVWDAENAEERRRETYHGERLAGASVSDALDAGNRAARRRRDG